MMPPAEAANDAGDRFQFTCQPGMACFTRCCANLNLVLTPYDILRLKRHLGVSAEAFLDRFTRASTDGTCGLPVVRLRMDPDTGRCPFVTADGCRVYADRPGACRLYPLGQALKEVGGRLQRRYFAIRESYCLGWDQGRVWRVADWLADQGLDAYQRMNTSFLHLSTALIPARIPWAPASSYPEVPLICPAQKSPLICLDSSQGYSCVGGR